MGGKYKLLPQIIPLFPKKIDAFVDLFGGGFNVGINVNANRIIYNDLENHVVELLKYFKDKDTNDLLSEIDKLIDRFNLSDKSPRPQAHSQIGLSNVTLPSLIRTSIAIGSVA